MDVIQAERHLLTQPRRPRPRLGFGVADPRHVDAQDAAAEPCPRRRPSCVATRLAPIAGPVVVQASRWAMRIPEGADDGQQATPQASKERRKGRYQRGKPTGSQPPARTPTTRFAGIAKVRGDPDQFSSRTGGGSS